MAGAGAILLCHRVGNARDLGGDGGDRCQPRAAVGVSDRLPRPAWLDTPGGARLVAALDIAGGATKLVGGAVRDGLLGRVASDIDLATRFAPADTVARLTAAGIKAVPTGIAHGTVTAVADGIVAEVTTLP
ncbi:MAG: hypothetical protein H7243_08540, partial [Sphingomonadaceae bacterium]|nr:hypothetical protein [Sphingomonadaceae bacterium]